MPRPDEQSGTPPTREAMQAAMTKMHTLDEQATQQIEELLTAPQKQALPAFLKQIDGYQMVGIPPEVLSDLKLTADQNRSILSVADAAKQMIKQNQDAAQNSNDFDGYQNAMRQLRRQVHEKAMAILTSDQREIVENFVESHPRPQPGDGGPPPPGPRGGNRPPPPGGSEDGNGPPPPDGGPPPP